MDGLWLDYFLMAHFAKIVDGVVTQVLVVHNNELLDNGIESEAKGVAFLQSLFGPGRWLQTSYSGAIRKNFAGIGDTYDEARDAFIAVKPYPSWILNEQTCRWQPPIPHPGDGAFYVWDEDALQWMPE
jgi:hypothetical protein